ncbi:ankyrin repeat-containing protein ITN1-like [Salvia miltiorrhiza]|uniref:ankyrin repeat-containing protein ITN1-like n=1 Tax=Salvia miltiorrhiza TaxID=226208 RepID=UPI0025AD8712|nr:ankyrin repeat-containing protein ITN1-like [Salvia miltiorrhiza]
MFKKAMVEELLNINPLLARNLADSQKSSPLHIAAAQGNVEIAKKLVSVAPEMRWCRNGQGLNPVHIAAMNGHVEILEELLRLDLFPAMERVHRGQTVLHLCVKHRQLRALKVLVEKLCDLVCAKDDDGETLLHWAARSDQHEVIKYLAKETKIDKALENSMGKTALVIFEENPHHRSYPKYTKYILSPSYYSQSAALLQLISKKRDQTMVVMVLIATMAFQAAISPPGGVWQDNTPPHRAGEAIMASTHPKMYKHLVRANTTAFVSSLITLIVVFVFQRELEKGFLLNFSTYTVWVSLAAIAVSYGGSVLVTMPNTETQSLAKVINLVVVLSISFVVIMVVLGFPIKRCWAWRQLRQGNFDIGMPSFVIGPRRT